MYGVYNKIIHVNFFHGADSAPSNCYVVLNTWGNLIMKKHLIAVFIILWATLLIVAKAQAEIVQILHTNDLHGFLENTVENKLIGGYPAIKYKIDYFKNLAISQNIKTITLDAGDFMEGNIFYEADEGRNVLSVMSEMGYDAVALGNHDWLMGTKDLNFLFKSNPPKFDLLASNVKINALLYPEINRNLKPYKIINISGKKIAILGLTTDEVFYKWRFYEGKISDPIRTAKKMAEKLRDDLDADFVIGLTHVGLKVDKEIAAVADLDLIVGGHSHTYLQKAVNIKNRDSERLIPIVQTGAHGKYLGRLIVELIKGKPLKILKYETILIKNDYEDEAISKSVKIARDNLNKKYGANWLNQKVGESRIPIYNSESKITPWTAFVVDSIKESRHADIAFHAAAFGGTNLPVGDVSREELFDTHPRVFDLKDKYGWHVYDVRIMGLFLKVLLHMAIKNDYAIGISGVTFDLVPRDGKSQAINGNSLVTNDLRGKKPISHLGLSRFKIKNIRINGRRVYLTRMYHVALPEGFVKGGIGITRAIKAILRKISKTDTSVLSAMEDKFKKIGILTSRYAVERNLKRDRGNMYVINKKNKIKLLKKITPRDEKQKIITSVQNIVY